MWVEKQTTSLSSCFKSSRLEELRQQTARVRELLFDPRATEFIIVTIPTVKATTIFAIAATAIFF